MTELVDDAGLLPPISPEEPCGPDLDVEGDPDFLNFIAGTEGQLPDKSYFSFKREDVDFNAAIAAGERLLARTHDLRLLVLLAKLAILNRDIHGFALRCAAMAQLLANNWDDVHPRGEDGDFTIRVAPLFALNDVPAVILPLQYAPLVEMARDVVTFRAQMAATGEVKLREIRTDDNKAPEIERLPNAGAIERILFNVDMAALTKTLQSLQRLKSSIARMRTIAVERVGGENAPDFKDLLPLAERMAAFIQTAVARRDPSVADPDAAEEQTEGSEAGAQSGGAGFGVFDFGRD